MTQTDQQAVDQRDSDIDEIQRLGVQSARTDLSATRAAVARLAGESDAPGARAALMAFWPVLAEVTGRAMVAGHLTGRWRAEQQFAKALRRRQVALDALDDAIRVLAVRTGATPANIAALAAQYGPVAARATAGLSARADRVIGEAVASAIAEGLARTAAIEFVQSSLRAAGLGRVNPFLIETQFRTEASIAWSAGQWNAGRSAAVRTILWGYEYVTVGDDRVRPEHAALEGFRAPVDHPVWDVLFPPNGWNCRCTVREIFIGDPNATLDLPPTSLTVQVDGEPVTITPGADEGFDFNPGNVFVDQITPSLGRPLVGV